MHVIINFSFASRSDPFNCMNLIELGLLYSCSKIMIHDVPMNNRRLGSADQKTEDLDGLRTIRTKLYSGSIS